jgi:hypothetical protein
MDMGSRGRLVTWCACTRKSLRRLSLFFSVKLLWQEMEDATQYSRFMQALTALFQLTDVFSDKASSLSRAPSVTVTPSRLSTA